MGMTNPRVWPKAIVLAVFVAGWSANPQSSAPKLVNICLITSNVKGLVGFYEPILGLKATRPSEDYAEFSTGIGVLAIFSEAAQEKYIPGSAEAARNKSMILEFRVAVDQEYRRLQSLVKTWVKPPSTQPWGLVLFTFATRMGILSIFLRRSRLNKLGLAPRGNSVWHGGERSPVRSITDSVVGLVVVIVSVAVTSPVAPAKSPVPREAADENDCQPAPTRGG
jgi:hypothetical protein